VVDVYWIITFLPILLNSLIGHPVPFSGATGQADDPEETKKENAFHRAGTDRHRLSSFQK